MKKISVIILSSSLALLSATAFACPKGTSLQGGTGPNHKGGKCVAVTGTQAKAAKKADTKKTTQTVKATEVKAANVKSPQPTEKVKTATTTTSTTTNHQQH
ncbi:hypothetical protein [Acinetobacter ihumii]|uniref:hypothetical protein n=1 Tax=Acinetobacter ihumii TaxID=2483802 RepID=UPI00148ED9DC